MSRTESILGQPSALETPVIPALVFSDGFVCTFFINNLHCMFDCATKTYDHLRQTAYVM